jgi:hypothetical protein
MHCYPSISPPPAHLTIEEDGSILGLPTKYQPATFDYTKAELTIGNRSLRLPFNLQPLFHSPPSDPFTDEEFKNLNKNCSYSFLAYPSRGLLGITVKSKTSTESIFIIIDLNKMLVERANITTGSLGTYPIEISNNPS